MGIKPDSSSFQMKLHARAARRRTLTLNVLFLQRRPFKKFPAGRLSTESPQLEESRSTVGGMSDDTLTLPVDMQQIRLPRDNDAWLGLV